MPTLTIEYQTESERLMLEQALAFVSQMRQLAETAPDGTVLTACEQFALADGRRLLCETLAGAVQHRVDATDGSPKKSPAREPRADAPAG